MVSYLAAALVASSLAATSWAHGNVTSPPARLPGAAMEAACGRAAVQSVLKDGTIPLEDVLGATASCQLDLCRGAKLADNIDRVQVYSPGQTVNFLVDLAILHEGPANVSIVEVTTNRVIGDPLIVFDTYADEKAAVLPPNNTNFNVTIPTNLGSTTCVSIGQCALQWFWFGTNAVQTYESCVDFVLVSSSLNPSFGNPGSTPVPSNSSSGINGPGSNSTGPAGGDGSSKSGKGGKGNGGNANSNSNGSDNGTSTASSENVAPAPAASAIPAKVDATPLKQQPAGVRGGIVGTIPVEDAAVQKKRKRDSHGGFGRRSRA